MEILKCFLFALLLSFSTTIIVHGQDQTGFISLDCGLAQDTDYFDERTGIHYISDAAFIDSGVNNTIAPEYRDSFFLEIGRQYLYLRSFPKSASRNCYALRPTGGAKGNKFLIRARFMYGNYDGKNRPPEFDLYLGVDFWDTLSFSPDIVTKEIIHTPSTEYINVCLVNTGRGVPFISALELRPLNNSVYDTPGSLQLIDRLNFGSASIAEVRYKDDIYDRIWWAGYVTNTTSLTTSSNTTIDSHNRNQSFQPPPIVMSTAITSTNATVPLNMSWDTNNSTDPCYLLLYFAELQQLTKSESREANIYVNGFHFYGPYAPVYLVTNTIYGKVAAPSGPQLEVIINRTANSTLPPIINAIELYTIKEVFHSQTDENEVAAMMGIKSMYGVIRNWEGDPCAPQAYVWVGVGCNFDGLNSLRIISLNLSSSAMNGVIAPYITNLTMIQSLDLTNNNLTGQVPDFLSGLAFLRVLHLKGNNFTGSVPVELLTRAKNGSLSLSMDGLVIDNTNPCQSAYCNTTTTTIPTTTAATAASTKKKTKFVVRVIASIAALLLLSVALAMFWFIKRRNDRAIRRLDAEKNKKDMALELKNRQFTYSEVQNMTNNFERVVGRGGFGTVYHGYVGETEVAVKMLSPSSAQGYKEFQAEANLLMTVHHKNLTSLVGYCNEVTNIGFIYEYMSNGSLERHLLSESNPHVLSWEQRLQIAMDAAQGLEYLHNGCKPAIVHRDVKCTNILLNEKFQAKIADFGLSRVFPVEGDTHVSTVVAGTPGYLDPEYYTSNRLTEKSDVYSFGVVLLEIITSRQAIVSSNEMNTHITQWVNSMLANGDVENIADPRLGGEFDVNSVWKAVELAMACVSRSPTKRPTMNDAVMVLKECLATEIARHRRTGLELVEDDSIGEKIPMSMESELGPLAT